MGYHIKRDGQFLCKEKVRAIYNNKYNFITFSTAHKSELLGCCDKCKERYYDIVSNLKEPIIVHDNKRRFAVGSAYKGSKLEGTVCINDAEGQDRDKNLANQLPGAGAYLLE
jgi:hypothetical protein